jgi:hypothetical protein
LIAAFVIARRDPIDRTRVPCRDHHGRPHPVSPSKKKTAGKSIPRRSRIRMRRMLLGQL